MQDGVLRSTWNTARGLIGVSTILTIIIAYGKEYQVPSIHELKDTDWKLAEGVMEVICTNVPDPFRMRWINASSKTRENVSISRQH